MTLKTIQIILILSIFTSFLSCNGQISEAKKETQSDSYSLGKLALELEDSIWKIYQDQKDNYWFGSNGEGIYHYDGKNLKQFTQKDGLVDNQIRGIQEDQLGNVFIQTHGGISKYDGNTFTVLKPIISSSNQWKSEPNDLWFICKGIPSRYDGEFLYELTLPKKNLMEVLGTEVEGVPFKDMNHSPYSVFGIDKDKEGNLWFGTATAGAFRYNGDSFLWIGEKELSTLPDGRVPGVRSMIEDKDGYFWLSNFKSKYRITDKDANVSYEKLEGIDQLKGPSQNRLRYFISGLSDHKGDLWMATYTGGVWKYDGETLLNYPITDGATEVLLISIYEDNQGTLWLGTDNAGVYKYNGDNFEKFEPLN